MSQEQISEKEQKFSDRLKQARLRAGLSQVEIARKLEVSDGAVGNWESDENMPGPKNLRKLAELLSVSVDYLRGTDRHYVINDLPEPVSDKVQTQIRTKIHQYLDFVMDSFRGDENKLRWLYIELKRHFPLNSGAPSEAQQIAKQASASAETDPSE